MRSRRLILGLILLTLLATCLAAAAKLRATPKYDRVQVGMTKLEVEAVLGPPDFETVEVSESGAQIIRPAGYAHWVKSEGSIRVHYRGAHVESHHISRRGPLERLLWLGT